MPARFVKALCLITSLSPLFSGALMAADETSMQAQAETWPRGHYPLVEGSDVVGQVQRITAQHDDTLLDIGRHHGIGYEEIRRANPDVRVWYPGEGTEVVLPTRFILPPGPREGVVVNIAEMRLYYYPAVKEGTPPRVETYPVSVGRMDWKTPLGETRITTKVKDPAWYPPQSILREHAEQGRELPSVVPPGPDNPLGGYAMLLDIPGYLIHSTNRPDGVGMRVTHGCIRMLPEDIESLFPRLPVGTEVRLVNEPFKIGWSETGLLHVQAYPSLDEAEDTLMGRINDALNAVTQAVKGRDYPVDYARLRRVVEAPGGSPEALVLVEAPFEISQPKDAVDFLYEQLELLPTLYSQIDASVAS